MKKLVVLLLIFVASNACGEIYTWKDNRGTAYYTNSLYEIPARYRSKAQLLDVATGKKMPITAGQSNAPAGSTAAPGQPAAPQQSQSPATITNLAPAASYQGPASPRNGGAAAANTPTAQPAASGLPLQRQSRAERRAQLRQNRGVSREE